MNGLPSRIGNYEIIREIGRGGMGVVYLAKHPTLSIDVAIKALYPDPSRATDDPVMAEARKRFKNEAELTARLKNLNVVNVYDAGADEDTGILFIVMDYLDGGNLKDLLIKKGKFTLEEALEIIRPVAKALEYVHGQGIIHRDLKPSNIMFLGENPVITDFGIAQDVMKGTILTETGKMVGSLPYLPPERVDEKPYDHRADIYSLGVIIYEMLTGKNPFEGETTSGVLKKIFTVTPDLTGLRDTDLPAKFRGIIDSMLEKDPEKRVSSFEALINFDPRHVPPMPEPRPEPMPAPAQIPAPKPKPEKRKVNYVPLIIVLVVASIVVTGLIVTGIIISGSLRSDTDTTGVKGDNYTVVQSDTDTDADAEESEDTQPEYISERVTVPPKVEVPTYHTITNSEVRNFLDSWCRAQDNRDSDAYMRLYSESDFIKGIKRTISGATTRYDYAEWKADRVAMINKTKWLNVDHSGYKILGHKAYQGNDGKTYDEVEVKFLQTYKANNYSDQGDKLMRIRNTSSGLRIIYEEMLWCRDI